MSPYPTNLDGSRLPGLMEVEHDIIQFVRYLPAGPLPDGGVRQDDLIQFYADPGGLRTVRAVDLIIV